jgi:hypothetical protein
MQDDHTTAQFRVGEGDALHRVDLRLVVIALQ